MSGAAPGGTGARTWFDRNTPTFAARYRASRTYRFLTWVVIVLLPIAVALHVYQLVQKHRFDPRRQPAGEITLLVTSTCPFSRELEAALKGADIRYRRLDVDKDDDAAWAYYAVNAHGVPVTVIGGEVVHGLRTGELRRVLDKAGHDTSRLQFRREADTPMQTTVKPAT